jgi:putative transcriptional regulator
MKKFDPHFLIAMPQLKDPNFTRSVVLILQHDTNGALGLIVNRSSEVSLGTFANSQGLSCRESVEKTPLFKGGPVEPERGWILHTDPSVEERQEVLPGLFVSATNDSLEKVLRQGSGPVRLILGYAGWAPGQLEREMQEGSWLFIEAKVEHILKTNPALIWKSVLRDLGIDPVQLVMVTGVH